MQANELCFVRIYIYMTDAVMDETKSTSLPAYYTTKYTTNNLWSAVKTTSAPQVG